MRASKFLLTTPYIPSDLRSYLSSSSEPQQESGQVVRLDLSPADEVLEPERHADHEPVVEPDPHAEEEIVARADPALEHVRPVPDKTRRRR
jgi:hypothetical protein